ncbi:MAG: Hsp20/alpha crystallin family protein [Spirochaetota bacterium]
MARDLMRWEPMRELSSLRDRMDQLMDRFLGGWELPAMEGWAPAIDVTETDQEIVVKADIPGIDQKDLEVTLSGDNLVIKGERKEEKEEKGRHFHRVERRYGGFQRAIPLPAVVDADKIKADYENGVLEVHLPKTEEARQRKIKINVK